MDLLDTMKDWLESDDIFLIKYGFIIANFTTLIFLYIAKQMRPQKVSTNDSNVLIVTAHPDDEAMFFLPTIKTLIKQKFKIHLLCLSNGNFGGLGSKREDELNKCAKYLGFESAKIINDKDLPDSMTIEWPLEKIRQHVQECIVNKNIEAIITFDDYGVSGHLNHRAVSRACRLVEVKKLSLLESTNIFRKYISIFDFFISSILTDDLALNSNPIYAWKAMKMHHSQFVWYRKLFIVFSRYAYVNTLIKIL